MPVQQDARRTSDAKGILRHCDCAAANRRDGGIALADHQGSDSPDNGTPNANAAPHEFGIMSTNETNGADVCGNTAVEGWAESKSGRDEELGFDKRSATGVAHCH